MEAFRRSRANDLTSREDLAPGTLFPALRYGDMIDALFARAFGLYYGYNPAEPPPFRLTSPEFRQFDFGLLNSSLKLHQVPRMGVLPKGLRFLIPRNSNPKGLKCGGHEALVLNPNMENVPTREIPKNLDPSSVLTVQLRGNLRYSIRGVNRETWGGRVYTFFTTYPDHGDESNRLYIATTRGLFADKLVMNRRSVPARVGAQIGEEEKSRLLAEREAELSRLDESARRGKALEGSAALHPFRGGLPGSGR